MSEAAIFGLIRDKQTRYYGARWASVFLFRELVWGPDEFEKWASQYEELDEFTDDCCGGAVVDFDRKRLVWCAEGESFAVPRVFANYLRLLHAAWPGYEISFANEGMRDLAKAVGINIPPYVDDDEWEQSIHDAARLYDDDDEEDEDDEYDDVDDDDDDDDEFSDDEVRAWVTLIDANQSVRHRYLEGLPPELLKARNSPIETLTQLDPVEVPPERFVSEGMWIDQPNRKIGIWGSRSIQSQLRMLREHWPEWTIQEAEHGYADQCHVSGPTGTPLGDAESLADIVQIVLSTKQFDMSSVLGALGGGLKRAAMKATGCLLFVICLPLVIFGLVSGDWKSTLIAMAITTAIVVVIFKVLEYRFKRSVGASMSGLNRGAATPPVAGPLDERLRRQYVDKLLAAAGLPKLAEIEPMFRKDTSLDLLT